MRLKNYLALLLLIIVFGQCTSDVTSSENIITSDIDHFWQAYDSISTTNDSIVQVNYLQTLFLDKGTIGQQAMIQARNYTAEEYLFTIQQYPEFWKSIRPNTAQAKKAGSTLEGGVQKLKEIYPLLKPAKIYFTVGALRSNGTTMDSMVLIGSELAFANKETITAELPERFSHLRSYFDSEPGENLVFLNVHEYIHTQQTTTIGNSLLAQTVLEGIAEYLAEVALDQSSPNPQIAYGKENDDRIRELFKVEMFSPYVFNWIWNSANNEFGIRDLAYYVGYRIAQGYYNQHTDKEIAIREMIEMNYNNEDALISFVNQSGYFGSDINPMKIAFEESRPEVIGLSQFENNDIAVSPTLTEITIQFNQEMSPENRNFELGPLGESNVLKLDEFIGFSEDKKSITFSLQPLEENKAYQIVVGYGFTNSSGIPLKPFLIEFTTGESD